MKRSLFIILLSLFALASCDNPAFNPESYPDATPDQVSRVEPLSWWVGMETPLQLLVQGPEISTYEVVIEGCSGVSLQKVNKADSPNYLFLDVKISPKASAGTCYLVFTREDVSFKVPYQIQERRKDSAGRESFSTADMIYLIMPDRFANGDTSNDSTDNTTEKADRSELFGRHGGDIQGVIDHLDYIAGLGATAIWSTPMLEDNQPRESYHGYACTDYYHIDPRFGSNELYKEYVAKAHEKGIKIIMDVVTNHCGTSHWWMEDLPFKDWIHVFPEYTGTNVCFSTNMDPNASSKDLYIQESGWFVPSMPDMNLDNPFVLNYFRQWGVWWMEYADLDGFRVDTYPYNEKNPMSEWCASIRREYPSINIVGECWTSSIPQLAYWQADNHNKDGFNSNLPSIMDFPLYEALTAGIAEKNPGWGKGMTRVYDVLSHDFVYENLDNMMIFAGNHDTGRIADIFGRNPSKVKLALTLMATMRGYPQIFAGDELMFTSCNVADPYGHGGLRVDFPGGWPSDATDYFTTEGRLAAKVHTDNKPICGQEIEDLYQYVSKLFNWRKTSDAVQHGKTMQFLSRDNTYAFFRYTETSAVFVFINNNSDPVDIPWSYYSEIADTLVDGVDVITSSPVVLSDETSVPGDSSLVVEFTRR